VLRLTESTHIFPTSLAKVSGQQPFKGATNEETFMNIVNGEFSFSDEAWDNISSEAKDFIKKLLTWDESSRPTAAQALKHPWIVKNCKSDESLRRSTSVAMLNLQQFDSHSKLKLATCSFIASQLLSAEEKAKIDEVFRAIDINNDGVLTKDEVKVGYKKVFETDLSDEEIDKIFKNVDADGTGTLEYSEFVFGALGKKELLSPDKLERAFKIFDSDGSGYISMQELRELLQYEKSLDDEAINKIIAEVDEDGDGEISFEEFLAMALSSTEAAAALKQEKAKALSRKDSSDSAPPPRECEISLSIKFSANSFVSHRLGQLTEHYEIIDYIAKGLYLNILCVVFLSLKRAPFTLCPNYCISLNMLSEIGCLETSSIFVRL
jgi:Ca2+-binding EF-hand superfamily protein